MPGDELELQLRPSVGALAPEWDELAAAQALPSPFLRSWWIDHAAGGELVVLCWFADGRLVGGMALERDRPGIGPLRIERLRSVGQGALAPDHLDLIAADPYRDRVISAARDWLRRPGSRVVDLDGLAGDGALAALFAAGTIERTGAPYAVLPDAHADYIAARPGKVRSTISRTAKRLARDGVEHRAVGPDDVSRALDTLAELHEGRWAHESQFLTAWPRFRAAAAAGAALGEVTADEMVGPEGTVVATELDIVVGGRTCFYQAGRDTDRAWRGAGSVLRAAIVERAIGQGHSEYDLLRGDESYKADWATDRREVVRCRVGIGPGGRLVLAAAHVVRVLGGLAARLRGTLSRAASRPDPTAPREPNG